MKTEQAEAFDRMPRAEVLRASPRMFEADWLDRLSRVHHLVPLAIFLPAIGALLWLGVDGGVGPVAILGWFAAGWLTWSLTEYWMHRIVFHLSLRTGSGRGCTGSSTASTTTIRTTGCGS